MKTHSSAPVGTPQQHSLPGEDIRDQAAAGGPGGHRAAVSGTINRTDHTCPIHPQVRQMGAGSGPICGMAPEPVVATEAIC